MLYTRGDHIAVRACYWSGSLKSSVKIIRSLCAHEAERERCLKIFFKERGFITDLHYPIVVGRTEIRNRQIRKHFTLLMD